MTDNIYRLVADETTMRRPGKEIRAHSYDSASEIASLVDQSVDALIEACAPVFKRSHRLIMLLWEERIIDENQIVQIPSIVNMTVDMLDYTLNKNGVAKYFIKKRGRNGEPDRFDGMGAPERMLRRMAGTGHWKFDILAGLIHCPTMRSDGSLILNKGFDAATKIYAFWDGKLNMPQIAETPTKDDAKQALQLFVDLLAGFPFVDKKRLDETVAIAAIITPILRVAFDHAPLFLILSHQSGTGKSFMQDVISTIVNGQRCPVVNDNGDTIEMEKRLSTFIMEGMPVIALDNLTHDLEGSMLCQMVTQRAIKVRVLGKSEAREIQWPGTILANGNNIRVVGDLVRRTLTSNMHTPEERPETRKFKFNPVHDVLANRGKYIAAALTIARAYQLAEDKVELPGYAGFDGWSNFVRAPLAWLSLPDVVDSQEQSRREDPIRSNVLELMQHWKDQLGFDESFTAAQIISKAIDAGWDSDFYDVLKRLAGSSNQQINSRRLGMWLTSIHGQVHVVNFEETQNGKKINITKRMRIEVDNKTINKYKLVIMKEEQQP
jgi:putative DNA primase/helicase